MGSRKNNSLFRALPSNIRELLKILEDRKVTLILDAEDSLEKVEIEAVIGNLLVVEAECDKFVFVDIDCICAVKVDREELLEGIFDTDHDDDNDHEKNHCRDDDIAGNFIRRK